jgi:hypothetical protein
MDNEPDGQFDNFALALDGELRKSDIFVRLHFDKKIISPKQAERLVHQLETVLLQLSRKTLDLAKRLADFHPISHRDLLDIWQWNAGYSTPLKRRKWKQKALIDWKLGIRIPFSSLEISPSLSTIALHSSCGTIITVDTAGYSYLGRMGNGEVIGQGDALTSEVGQVGFEVR